MGSTLRYSTSTELGGSSVSTLIDFTPTFSRCRGEKREVENSAEAARRNPRFDDGPFTAPLRATASGRSSGTFGGTGSET